MSFFAGFVQGVFEGKDWREARDDRARQRKMEDERFGWEREDREWTGEARNRQRSEWGRTDYERSRADSEFYRQQRERKEEEASQRRINESLARTLGLTDDAAPANEGNQGMSVMDAVPQDTRTAPPPSSQGLTVRGALGELGQGTQGGNVGGNVMQDRLSERVAGQQSAQAAPAATRAAPVQQAAAAPDPALVAEGAQIAGVQPYTPGQDRNAPPQSRGFSLNNLIASPAAASTMPEGEVQPQAPQPSFSGPAQEMERRNRTFGGMSPLPAQPRSEPEPRRDDAAAAPEPQGRVPMLSEQDAARSQRAISLFPQGQDFDTPEEAAARQQGRIDMDTRRQQREDARNARIERANAQSAAAAGVDIGPVSPPTQPAPTTAPTQPQSARTPEQQAAQRGTAQRTDDTQFFIDDVPMSISGPRRLATGSVADVVAQVTGSPVVEGSVKAAGESIAKSAGMSAAQALTSSGDKKPPTKTEVRAVSQRAGKAFSREAIRAHERVLAQEGKLDQIPAWREFAQAENTRAAVEKLTEAMFYWDMNDEANALQSVVELYNMNGYYDDGLSILSEGTAFAYDAAGNITGLTATFRDEAAGNVFQRTITGPGDKIMAIVLGSLSPEATFEAALEAVGGIAGAASPQNAQSPIPDISHSDWRGYLDQARKSIAEERGLEIAAVPQAEVEARARQIIANLPDPRTIQRGSAQGDVPVWQ